MKLAGQPDPAAVVELHFHSFEPKSVTIHSGEAVLWRNSSPIWHTVTADPKLAEEPQDVALPPGVEPFDSGRVEAGTAYEHIFTVPGTYRYFCKPHELKGMVAEVIVEPPK
jgi:plastocyanin